LLRLFPSVKYLPWAIFDTIILKTRQIIYLRKLAKVPKPSHFFRSTGSIQRQWFVHARWLMFVLHGNIAQLIPTLVSIQNLTL